MPRLLEPPTVTLTDVCFCHWPVDPDAVAPLVPDWLTVDRADGTAWVGAVAMTMGDWRAAGLDLGRSADAVNVRTYVRTPAGDRAVYFLSLDVTDSLAVETARSVFRLPYYRADIDRRSAELREDDPGSRAERVCRRSADGRTRIEAERRNAGPEDAGLTVEYEPAGTPTRAAPDTLASFLVERYRYAVEGPFGTRLVGGVGHEPWELQPADVAVEDASLLAAAGIDPTGAGVDAGIGDGSGAEPIAHYSPGTEFEVGLPRPT